MAEHPRRCPFTVIKAALLPAPGMLCGLQPVPRTNHQKRVQLFAIGLERTVAHVVPYFPVRPSIGRLLGRRVTLQQECGALPHARIRREIAVAPDLGGNDIGARLEPLGKIDAFVMPLGRITPLRPEANRMTVDPKPVPRVTGDMHDVAGGLRRQRKDAAE